MKRLSSHTQEVRWVKWKKRNTLPSTFTSGCVFSCDKQKSPLSSTSSSWRTVSVQGASHFHLPFSNTSINTRLSDSPEHGVNQNSNTQVTRKTTFPSMIDNMMTCLGEYFSTTLALFACAPSNESISCTISCIFLHRSEWTCKLQFTGPSWTVRHGRLRCVAPRSFEGCVTLCRVSIILNQTLVRPCCHLVSRWRWNNFPHIQHPFQGNTEVSRILVAISYPNSWEIESILKKKELAEADSSWTRSWTCNDEASTLTTKPSRLHRISLTSPFFSQPGTVVKALDTCSSGRRFESQPGWKALFSQPALLLCVR